ncbi:MAG: hypothetical protein J0M12_10550 [Deltaproteobacteria bacterium]|nr:hypothetical protein [Deltaproteobacteria bacterium]
MKRSYKVFVAAATVISIVLLATPSVVRADSTSAGTSGASKSREVSKSETPFEYTAAVLDAVNQSCDLKAGEPPRNEPCKEVKIICSDDPREINPRNCESGETACCHLNECELVFPKSWCDSKTMPCLKPGKIDREKLVQCLLDSKPTKLEDMLHVCTARHEAEHAKNPAWWPDCANEAGAFWVQIICLFNFYNQKCVQGSAPSDPQEREKHESECRALLGERCTMLATYELHKCRCEQEPPLPPLTACPTCEKRCNDQLTECGKNFLPPSFLEHPEMQRYCKDQAAGYCTSNPNR